MRKAFSYKIVAIGCIAGIGMVGSANAQLATATNNLVTARTTQNLAGVAVGTGTQQGASVVDVQSKGRPVIGVGVGSGKVDHFGSAASVSVANNARIVGVDGPGGVHSPNSVSVRNPTQRPILSGVGNAPGALPH
ncbi:hypothetical protein ACSBM8_16290 [Sphingomonas sp. ASY06-1R]|uniref:hypothetical protein n=1 Tax=Sphingomonas sp. ASY06-1R TaxID=3445771 RepID=UPI003FA25537